MSAPWLFITNACSAIILYFSAITHSNFTTIFCIIALLLSSIFRLFISSEKFVLIFYLYSTNNTAKGYRKLIPCTKLNSSLSKAISPSGCATPSVFKPLKSYFVVSIKCDGITFCMARNIDSIRPG